MTANRIATSIVIAIFAFLGHISCTAYNEHLMEPRRSLNRRLQPSSGSPGATGSLGDASDESMGDAFRENNLSEEQEELEGDSGLQAQATMGLMSSAASPSASLLSPSLSPSSSSSSSSSSPSSSSSSSESYADTPREELMSMAGFIESRRRARARQRHLRTQSFRRTILNGVGMERPPSTSMDSETRRALLNWLLQIHGTENAQLVQRVQEERRCYLGQCSTPPGMNASLWQDTADHTLKLNFPLPRLNRRRSKDEEVDQAKLNVFVRPRAGCPCLDESGEPVPGFIVSLHQFTRRLVVRKGRVIRRTTFLDSARVPFGGNVWVRLDMRRAAQLWMTRPRRNLGLEIRVSHVNGTSVDARSVLGLPHCSTSQIERSCRYESGPKVEMVSWPVTWHDRQIQLHQGHPYLDLRTIDKSQTTVDLEQTFGSAPLQLGNLEDFYNRQ
ncbi:growth/differentiation factor 8-like [Plakobranchus ocellatus]|uniref:Growth/differentiation factor 8-like n=1 Tax=Plakobranchus ocellatus TaxID=259542 RepID=A0AAV4BMH0_9GAST|nr:growth/differentiation factor 8-like [Plakobranchus ocellatus]